MDKHISHKRSPLKRQLSLILMIYLDGLQESDKGRFSRFVDRQVGLVVNRYVALVDKPKQKINRQLKIRDHA